VSVVRWWIVVPVAAVVVVGAALVVASRRDEGPVLGTIGESAVPMRSAATYRLTLGGQATRIGGASLDGLPPDVMAPGGHYRLEFRDPGKAVVDTRTGERRVVTSHDGSADWGPRGMLAYTDRHGGLTRLVIFDPGAGTRRVVVSHVCGDTELPWSWSPDGRRLAVAVSPPGAGCSGGGGSDVLVTAEEGGGRQRIVEPPSARPVAWTQNGSGLLIASREDGRDGSSRLVDLRTGKAETVLPTVSVLRPGAWSAGHRFYAAIAIDRSSRKQVVVIVSGSLRRLVRVVVFGQVFAWSPKRQWLAVSEEKRIRVLNAVTGRTVAAIPVRTLYGFATWLLTWDPNGRSLIAAVGPSSGRM
jgi:WD40 repeat protein